MSSVEEEYESLIQFLYMAPIGLAQTMLDGAIVMANSMCAQLLLPLSADGELANLFAILEGLAPDLRHLARDFTAPNGSICDAVQLLVPATLPHRKTPQILSLSLLKIDCERLMAVLSDVTPSVKRTRDMRQNQAWRNSVADGLTDHAATSIDAQGRVVSWNPNIGRVTGFDSDTVVGQFYSVFYPVDGLSMARMLNRLHEAARDGWSMDEGWLIRADGSQFWGNCLIAPTPMTEHLPAERSTYTLILRDISEHREATEATRLPGQAHRAIKANPAA